MCLFICHLFLCSFAWSSVFRSFACSFVSQLISWSVVSFDTKSQDSVFWIVRFLPTNPENWKKRIPRFFHRILRIKHQILEFLSPNPRIQNNKSWESPFSGFVVHTLGRILGFLFSQEILGNLKNLRNPKNLYSRSKRILELFQASEGNVCGCLCIARALPTCPLRKTSVHNSTAAKRVLINDPSWNPIWFLN